MIPYSSVCYVDLGQLYSNFLVGFFFCDHLMDLVKVECINFLNKCVHRYLSCVLRVDFSVSEDPVRFSELESY